MGDKEKIWVCRSVPNEFTSGRNYDSIFRPLVKEEAYRARIVVEKDLFGCRKAVIEPRGYERCQVVVLDSIFRINPRSMEENELNFQPKEELAVFVVQKQGKVELRGRVIEVQGLAGLQLLIVVKANYEFNTNGITFRRVFDRSTFDRQCAKLKRMRVPAEDQLKNKIISQILIRGKGSTVSASASVPECIPVCHVPLDLTQVCHCQRFPL